MEGVLETLKDVTKSFGVDTRAAYQALSARSIKSALVEQGLTGLVKQCRELIPDISDQYTEGFDRTEYERYWEIKMRGLHAFQTRCMLDAVEFVNKDQMVVVDIGDSCGNHGIYLKGLAPENRVSRVISVNLDPVAVEKVRKKGGEAIHARAEELDLGSEKIDLFMSFEMVEHLTDPARFLYQLAKSEKCEYFLMSVPYVRQSRVGLNELRGRADLPERIHAEALHIFELSPEDWVLLARFAGWSPITMKTYLQYPRKSWERMTSSLWQSRDYEGFFSVLLKRDLSIANRYQDW